MADILHRILASAIAFLIAFFDGFNKGLQLHNKLSWEYCLALKWKRFYYLNWARYHTIEAGLVVEIYAYAKKKKKIKERPGPGIPNSVTQQKKNRQFRQNHAKNRQSQNISFARLEIPQYQNSRPQLHKYRMKICQTLQYRKIFSM